MDAKVAVFRDAQGLQEALETVKRLKEEAGSCYVDDKGARLQSGRPRRS